MRSKLLQMVAMTKFPNGRKDGLYDLRYYGENLLRMKGPTTVPPIFN